MKKTSIYILSGFIFLFLFTDCRKKAVDRRNKYTGDWQFHYTVSSISTGNEEVVVTGHYKGKIFYDGRKDKKHMVHLQLSESWEEEFELAKNDELIQCEKRGRFNSENLLEISGSSAGCRTRLGGEISYTITGSR